MSQKILDRTTTILGLIAGVSSVLGGAGMIGGNTAGIITGISTACSAQPLISLSRLLGIHSSHLCGDR